MSDIASSISSVLRADMAEYLSKRGGQVGLNGSIPAFTQNTLSKDATLLSQVLEDGQITGEEFKSLEKNLIDKAIKELGATPQNFGKLGEIVKQITSTIDELVGKDLADKLRNHSSDPVQISFEKVDFNDSTITGGISAKFSTKIYDSTLTADASANAKIGGKSPSIEQPMASTNLEGQSYKINITANSDEIKSTVKLGKDEFSVEAESSSKLGSKISASYGTNKATAETNGNVTAEVNIGAFKAFAQTNFKQKNNSVFFSLGNNSALIKAGATVTKTSVNGEVSFSVAFASGEKFKMNAEGKVTAGNKQFNASLEASIKIKLGSDGTAIKIGVGLTSSSGNPNDHIKVPETVTGVTAEIIY